MNKTKLALLTKLARLREEIDVLHFANVVYWKYGREHGGMATAEHNRRQRRLRQIAVALGWGKARIALVV